MNRIEKYLNLEKTGFAWEDDLLLFTPNRLTGAVGENENRKIIYRSVPGKGKKFPVYFIQAITESSVWIRAL